MLEKNPGLTPNQVKGAIMSRLCSVPGVGAAVDANAAIDGYGSANAGLTPNTLVDPRAARSTGSRASFRRASFRDAAGSPLRCALDPRELPLRLRARRRADRSTRIG